MDMSNGRTIQLFLVDGDPQGLMVAEFTTLYLQVLVVPMRQIEKLKDWADTQPTGTYFLVGPDPEEPEQLRVYVGETEDVLRRLPREHAKDASKEFATRAIVIISKDENLTKAHVAYLEREFQLLAHKAGKVNLANPPGDLSNSKRLPRPDIADMQFVIKHVRMLLPVLGFDFLEPKPTPTTGPSDGTTTMSADIRSPIFKMTTGGADAEAQEVMGHFFVLQGSKARVQTNPSWTAYKKLRERLITEGKLMPDESNQFLIFTENTEFGSPSAAAAVVYGGNINGRINWKTDDQTTYADWVGDEEEASKRREEVEDSQNGLSGTEISVPSQAVGNGET
jgi:hypothetical protein